MDTLYRKVFRRFWKTSQKFAGALGTREYDARQNEEAKRVQAAIVAQWPDRRLSADTRQHIRDYSRDVLGSTIFVPWLEAFTAFRGEFVEGWIPINYLRRYVIPHSLGHYGSLSHKTLAPRLLEPGRFPDLAYRVNGVYYDGCYNPVSADELSSVIFSDDDVAFAKWEASNKGRDVLRISREHFNPADLGKAGNLVIQRRIVQHPFFDALSPTATATLRVTTVKSDGKPAEMRAAYARFGRKGDDAIRSASHLRVAIGDVAGTLCGVAAMPDWTTTEQHPDTTERFAGKTIPFFQDMVEACEQLHDRLPHIRVIGWDACVSPEGRVELLEWNDRHPDVKFSEAAVGPCFTGLGWEKLHKEI